MFRLNGALEILFNLATVIFESAMIKRIFTLCRDTGFLLFTETDDRAVVLSNRKPAKNFPPFLLFFFPFFFFFGGGGGFKR